MPYFVNKFVEIVKDVELNAMHVKFFGFTPHEEFSKIMDVEFEMIRQQHLHKCLIDLRLLPVHASESKDYVKDVWFPTVKSLGVKFVAFVSPQSALAQMSMRKAHETSVLINDFRVGYFKDEESAREWLLQSS